MSRVATVYSIYALVCDCEPEHRRYIGRTMFALETRLAGHLKEARRPEGHKFYLDTHKCHWIRRHERLGHTIQIVLVYDGATSPEELAALEVFYMWAHQRFGHELTNSSSQTGPLTPFSDETRAKMSAAKKGKKLSPEHAAKAVAALRKTERTPEMYARIAAAQRGKKRPGTGAKIAAAITGYKHTPETRARMSEAHKGRSLSPEHAAKLRASRIGVKATPETRAKIAAAQKGKQRGPLSDETRANISVALKGRKKSPEQIAKHAASLTGYRHTPEARATMSAAAKGKPKSEEHRAKFRAYHNSPEGKAAARKRAKLGASPGGLMGSHMRWHVNRGVVNPDCIHCRAGDRSET